MKSVFLSLALALATPAFAMDPSANCFNNLDTHPGLVQLSGVIALGSIKHQTLEMMTSPRYPTPAEKPVIKAWVRERDRCFVLGESWRLENMPADKRSIIESYYAKNKLLIADLYSIKITYGEFATKRASLSSDLIASLNEAALASQDSYYASPEAQARLEQQRSAARAAMLETATKILNGG